MHRSSTWATTFVPAGTGFLVALTFGIGCLFARARWLREGLTEPQGKRLLAEIKKHYRLDETATDEA